MNGSGEGGEDEADSSFLDLPSREIKGTSRVTRIKLDLDFGDEPPEESVCVRVAAVDETGNEVMGEDGKPIAATSEEFYLTLDQRPPADAKTRRRQTVSSVAEGRLRAALETRDPAIMLTQPAWIESRGTSYFTVRADQRTVINVAVSPFLLELERRTLAEPRSGGRYTLDVEEVQSATSNAIVPVPLAVHEDEGLAEFWRTRSVFFERLRHARPPAVLESADWTPELSNAALRYAQAYGASIESRTAPDLKDLLSIDTLLIRVGHGDGVDDAALVLPTHPLRVAWLASHAALLRKWEDQCLQHNRRERRKMVDLDLVRDLHPANIPAFAWVWTNDQPLVFFQNLGFTHGVALPADASDPLRRLADVAEVVGFREQPAGSDDRRPDRLARRLRDFLAIHPYADPLRITLVNPDQGSLIAETLELLAQQNLSAQDDEEPPIVPAYDITAYMLDEHQTALVGLDPLRTRQHEHRTRYATDYLQPGLSTAVRPLRQIAQGDPEDAHVAIISDLSQPSIRTLDGAARAEMQSSLSLYGLIARFASTLVVRAETTHWRYGVITAGSTRVDTHPAGQRFGDILTDLHAKLLGAGGRLLDPRNDDESVPALEVRLDETRVGLLDRIHAQTDWVVTLDRFFGVDYYDSPGEAALSSVAQKYLIDYSPEFIEGLGQRLMVTTAWRDEVALVLRRAMEDLGFTAVDQSVGRLLRYLKTVSGRLALQALSPESNGAEAVSLGAVIAWLQAKKRLNQAVLVPIDAHLGLFGPAAHGAVAEGQRRCDLVLIGLRRGIVDATFIEVKWRRGPLGRVDGIIQDMGLQLHSTGQAVEQRFFDPDRVDGALQRAVLANVLRFYCRRAQRYGLLDPNTVTAFHSYLAQLERPGWDFRANYEGFIVSLEDPGRRPVVQDDLTVTILSARDFEQASIDIASVSRTVIPDEPEPQPIETGAPPSNQLHPTQAGPPQESANGKGSFAGVDKPALSEPDGIGNFGPGGQAERPRQSLQVVLGEGPTREVAWRPSIQGSPHLFISGIPGQGKSWTVLRLLIELARQGVPSLVFDFHGQIAAADNAFSTAVRPIVLDATEGLPFSPFECGLGNSAVGWQATAMAVSEIFAYVCGLGDIQRDALYICVRDAYRAYGFGSGDESQPEEYPTLSDILRRIELAERQKRSQNLLARCRPLLEMDIFRPPVGKRNDLIDSVRQGLVVDLHNVPSETLQLATGAFLLRKLYRDMFQWGATDRLQMAIVLDEAHRLSRDITLPKIMKEGRKFGVAVVVASQGIADFHADVLGNAGTKIAFRANYPESRKIAGFFRGRAGQDLVALLQGLSVGNALIQTPEMPVAEPVRMRPPNLD